MIDISQWSMVFAAGRVFVGHLTGNGVLRPCYEVQAGLVPGPHGQMAKILQVLPPLAFASLVDGLPMPREGAIVKPCSSLSANEQAALAKGVAGAEELTKGIRAADSGLVIARVQ